MSNLLDTSKSTLGKLLAAENIRIEHKQVPGPSFDVKNRVLVLPMWKSVDADLYDLMIGHEVGHALYTPADGWMDKVKEYGKSFKTMLNLVEDARIEKKMKRKYPGLRKPMYNGYTALVDRGFFGVTWGDMNSLPFPDRLNIYFKLGPRSGVVFSEKEQDLVNRIDSAETWDEVMTLAHELHQVAQQDAEDMQTALEDLIDALENSDGSENGGDGEGSNGDAGESIQDIIDKLRREGKHELADRLENASENMMRKLQAGMLDEHGEVKSMTADAMEQNQHKLVDESALPNAYVTFPNLNSDDWVTPAKITHKLMVFPTDFEVYRESIYNNFMATNKRYVSYLVKEFELRRNAAQFAKAKVSKTGDLDMDKMWKHKLSEDLFLQSTIVPNGKNHGMLMLIDLSSSMHANMAGTIEQVVTMAMFCRKVNIPFDVYGFVDNGYHHLELEAMGIKTEKVLSWEPEYEEYVNNRKSFIKQRNDTAANTMQINSYTFRLKQLLHFGMKAAEFTHSIKNLLLLAEAYRRSNSYYGNYVIPSTMELGGTPLNEAILVFKSVADKFKDATKVEVLSTIVLTDGDASYGLRYLNENHELSYFDKYNFILEDKKTNHQVKFHTYRATESLLEMYRHLTGSRMVGFYLMGGNNHRNEIHRRAIHGDNFSMEKFEKQYKEQFAANRFFGITGLRGYDVYFMMPGRDLEIDDVNMDKVLQKNDKTSLLRAFKKVQNTKMVSRVFLNQFIKQVA